MKKKVSYLFFLSICFLITLTSCGTTRQTIQGNYVVKNKITTNTPYDKVWEHIIDFFAENSIPIGVISKESGLITANGVSFDENQVSFEDKNGEINNQYAWFVLPYSKNVVGGRATCSFNVRVKANDDKTTTIYVNLSNLIGYYNIEVLNTLTFEKQEIQGKYQVECKSTGQFERELLYIFR